MQFKRHPCQCHDSKWLHEQRQLDDWKLWILNDLIQHEVVINIHDGRPGSEEAYEVQRVSAGLPQQEWKHDKANANSRQADVIQLDCYDLWRILAQQDFVYCRLEECGDCQSRDEIYKHRAEPENWR